MNELPVPSERVLPTLNNDGSRRWIRPKTFRGRYYYRRLVVAWSLILFFVAAPLIPVGGHPMLLFDVPSRKFYIFGATLLATDGRLLMLALLALFVAIFWLTALFGRIWCGWGCPQTLYLEFVFRPLEQWLEGTRGQQLKLDRDGANWRRVLKFAIYAVLSFVLANVFLSYFVGVHRLKHWLLGSPFEHPMAFVGVTFVAALVFFDFAYFREQMCTIACPYARLQSVLLDKRSLIVKYDEERGEPRGRGRNAGGDCIDCHACVVTCPTGIDIRRGLQMECVACTQCIDACDQVMTKLHKPLGLIRYGSQTPQETGSRIKVRPRVLIYPTLMVILLGALLLASSVLGKPQITVLRGIGAPYVLEAGKVRNQLRIKIHNRSESDAKYELALEEMGDSELILPYNPILVPAGQHVTSTAYVLSSPDVFTAGSRSIKLLVKDEEGNVQDLPYKLLGPFN